MARYAMVTDLRKCVGCQACTVACNAEWEIPAGQARTHVRQTPVAGKFPHLLAAFYVAQCNHCDRPPCVQPCPSGATMQGPDGVVTIDPKVCIGCGYCVEACPYEARFLNQVTKRADKCDFCAARTARGAEPACVATCTAHAKFFGDLEDRTSEVFRMVYERAARRVESATTAVGPNVYYLGKPAHLDHLVESFPPREPQLLSAGQTWSSVARPLVLAALGATFAGQAVAFFAQLHKGEDSHE
jgi:tetrathionate reductase subunit B